MYAAERITLGDIVALKVILPEKNTPANRARFVQEARAAARIRHPHVVKIFDFGDPVGGAPYMVMELLEGPTLADEIAASSGGLSVQRTLEIFSRLCAAVEAGHRRGVVHRDLKPGNVIVARTDDDRETIKVTDFGLARMVSAGGDISSPGLLVGTVSYMSPEQAEHGRVSPASDVFALAVMLYEMLLGVTPFRGSTLVDTLFRITQGRYRPPLEVEPELPSAIANAIEQGLRVDPAERPRSPERLATLAGAVVKQRRSRPTGPQPSLTTPIAEDITVVADSASSSPRPSDVDRGEAVTEVRSQPAEDAFVGRAEVLARLQRAYAELVEGEPRLALVTGEAGIGKTRVLDRLLELLHTKGATVLRGRAVPHAGARPPPYETFLGMLGPDHDGLRERLHGKDEDKWQSLTALAQALMATGRGTPLVVAIDDLQWASSLDLELLAYLAHASGPQPVLVVATARHAESEDLRAWCDRLAAQRVLVNVPLAPFDLTEIAQWLRAAFGRVRMRPQDLRRIHHATAGNPFAVVELVRQLVDAQTLHRDEGGWGCEDLFHVSLPESVQALLHVRLRAVSTTLRPVLELASVLGETFRSEVLHAASGLDNDTLEGLIDEAIDARLLAEEDAVSAPTDLRFGMAGLRRVLYDGLRPRARRRLHGRAVAALQANDASSSPALLAYHCHAVGDWPATLQHGIEAGRAALARHDHDGAEECLRHASEAREHLAKAGTAVATADAAAVACLSGTLGVRLGRYSRAEGELEHAVELAADHGDPSLALDARLELIECRLGLGRFVDGIEVGHRAIEAALALGDRARAHTARIRVARCAGPLGRIDEALQLLQPVLTSVVPEHAVLRALALREQAWLLAKRGAFVDAEEAARHARSEARRAGDTLAEYRAVSVLGVVHAECGHHEQAIQWLHRALELARALSLRRREGIETSNLGECHYLRGEFEPAFEYTRQGLAIFIEIGDVASEGDCRVNLGRMLRAMGRHDDAVAMLDEGRRACAASGRSEYEAIALCEQGDIHLEQGTTDKARTCFASAIECFAAADSAHRWRAELGLARACFDAGDDDEGRPHATRALALIHDQRQHLPPGVDAEPLDDAERRLRTMLGE